MAGNSYPNNKLYFQMWVIELQFRLLQHDRYKHITVNGVHPGYVNSGIWETSQWTLTHSVMKTLVGYFAITPQQGSLAIVRAASGIGGTDGKGGGKYFNRIWEAEPLPLCHDKEARLKLWRKLDEDLRLSQRGLLDILGQ